MVFSLGRAVTLKLFLRNLKHVDFLMAQDVSDSDSSEEEDNDDDDGGIASM